MAIKKISEFVSASPTSADKILFEQNNKGKSCSIEEAVNTCSLTYGEIINSTDLSGKIASASSIAYLRDLQGIKPISLVPAIHTVTLTDMVTLQGIIFVTGAINRNFGVGTNKNIFALQDGLVIAQDFCAPLGCYEGVIGEISGFSGDSYIKASISSITGDGKFNFFFRVRQA